MRHSVKYRERPGSRFLALWNITPVISCDDFPWSVNFIHGKRLLNGWFEFDMDTSLSQSGAWFLCPVGFFWLHKGSPASCNISILQLEIMVIRAAVDYALRCGQSNVLFESDSLSVIKIIKVKICCLWEVTAVLNARSALRKITG